MSGSSRASTHSLHKVESFGCSADGSKAGSRLSKPAGPGTSLESGFKEEGCGLRPRGIIPASSRCTATSEVHQTKAAAAHSAYAHQTKAATALQARQAAFKVATASELHHEGSIQGSSADSTPSSWQSCSSLLPSECSADSLTYQEQPQHQHDFRIVQCYPQGGLQLVDGARSVTLRMACSWLTERVSLPSSLAAAMMALAYNVAGQRGAQPYMSVHDIQSCCAVCQAQLLTYEFDSPALDSQTGPKEGQRMQCASAVSPAASCLMVHWLVIPPAVQQGSPSA
eukprot:scaffold280023_cov19-Tisochrysis_lutea.AAC.1